MKHLKFNADEMLKRAELKTVLGGTSTELTNDDGLAVCEADCGNDRTVTCEGSICTAEDGESGFCTSNGSTKYC